MQDKLFDNNEVGGKNTDIDVNGNYIVKGIISDLKDISDTFSTLKTGFENVLTGISSMVLTDNKTEKHPVTDDTEDDDNSEVSNIYNCSKLEDLVERISDDISFDQDTGFFKCEICFERKDPYVRGAICEKTGIFKLDLKVYQTALTLSPNTQPDCFRNLKKCLVRHVRKSERHLKNVNLNAELQKIEADKQSRNYQIGLSLGRVRYTDIKHGNSYLSFEDSVLTASMNGTDTGDINNSRQFAKDLTVNIKEVMDEKLKDAFSAILPATDKKRQVGVVSDKITPNKRTGHIMGVIVPVPENPLSASFLSLI